jgi:hypothetical protein
VWVDSCSLDLGRVRAGIRANGARIAAEIARGFRDRTVDDPDVSRNFSVAMSPNPTRAHLLFWGGCVVARSFDPHRIIRSLVDHLAAHTTPPEGAVWISSLPYVRDGRAALLPYPLKDDLRILDRQLRIEGYVAVDAPRALVDLTTGDLIVADPLRPDWDAMGSATSGVPCRRAEPTVEYGRYPIDRWVFIDYSGKWGSISRATATRAAVLEILGGIESLSMPLLERVASLFERIDASSMFPDHPNAALTATTGRPPPA